MGLKGKWLITSVLIIITICSALFIGWQYPADSDDTLNKDTVFQLAAFNTFSTGKYAGVLSYSEIAKHGDFGIGTFDGLNGEMLAFDGIFYQIASDGIPRVVEETQTSPYATVTYFDTDLSYIIAGLNYTGLKSYLDSRLGSTKDVIYAIKVSGDFSYVQARSPEKQVVPYPDLTNAIKTQSIFNLTDVSGTAVGYWFPSSMDGIDYAGYHLHIITDDKTAGGHLLECNIDNALIEVDVIKNYNLILP